MDGHLSEPPDVPAVRSGLERWQREGTNGLLLQE